MPSALLRLCVAAVAVSSVLTVAACGTSGSSGKPSSVVQADNGEAAKTGPQVMKDAAAAMIAAGAVHVTGVGTQGKPPQKLTVEGQLQSEGMTMSARTSGGEQDFISIGKSLYMKGFGGQATGSMVPKSLEKTIGNHWVKFGGDSSDDSSDPSFVTSADDDGDTTTLGGMAKSFSSPEDGVTINSKVTRASLNGQPVVIVTESNGASFKVAATGTPYVLQAVMVDDSKTTGTDEDEGAGTLTFTDYGKRVTITAPADVVDLEQLLKENPKALLPSSFPSALPSDFPTDFPTDLPSGFPTDFPTDIPSS
jgi:hypothetical protein